MRFTACLAIVLLTGCREPAETPPAFTVMTYNLDRYSLSDRDGDGQPNEPKPTEERQAVINIITQARPDVLAIQEIGSGQMLDEFRLALEKAGLPFPDASYILGRTPNRNLAVLSRHPIIDTQLFVEDRYSIGDEERPVRRGFIQADIAITSNYTFRLLVAHLKSKVFHRLGQTEMRRNEARLLGNHVRDSLEDDPDINLVVVGDLGDDPNSAALREITSHGEHELLHDLRPRDSGGDAWTCFDAGDDTYTRVDYILVSRGMLPEAIQDETRIIRSPLTYKASDHRPLVAAFSANAPLQAQPSGPKKQ